MRRCLVGGSAPGAATSGGGSEPVFRGRRWAVLTACAAALGLAALAGCANGAAKVVAPVTEEPETVRTPDPLTGATGLQFGAWRLRDPEAVTADFAAHLASRHADLDAAARRADLQANGFTCTDDPSYLECTFDVFEDSCVKQWSVDELENVEPDVRFGVFCFGALPDPDLEEPDHEGPDVDEAP